jgi:hypothetical protein
MSSDFQGAGSPHQRKTTGGPPTLHHPDTVKLRVTNTDFKKKLTVRSYYWRVRERVSPRAYK